MNPENKDFWVEAGEYAEGIFQSDRQKHFEQKCLERGADYHLVKSLDKFIEVINSYEKIKP